MQLQHMILMIRNLHSCDQGGTYHKGPDIVYMSILKVYETDVQVDNHVQGNHLRFAPSARCALHGRLRRHCLPCLMWFLMPA